VLGETHLGRAVPESGFHIGLDVVEWVMTGRRTFTVVWAVFVEMYVVVAHDD
jgi:hypothetical protein